MSLIKITKADGIIPALAPKFLPETAAQVARNVRFGSGRLEPFNGMTTVTTVTGNSTIFLWRRNVNTWLSWSTDVDVVRSPIADDQWYRLYYTGDGVPKVRGWAPGDTIRNLSQTIPDALKATAVPLSTEQQAASGVNFDTGVGMVNTCNVHYGSSTDILTGTFAGCVKSDNDRRIALTFTVAGDLYASTISSLGTSLTIGGFGADFPTPITIPRLGVLTLVSVTPNVPASGSTFLPTFSQTWTFDVVYEAATEPVAGDVKYVYYVQTLVNDWGEETPPSPVSNLVEWAPSNKITLDTFGTAPSPYSIRRIYRSEAGTSKDAFAFLVELATSVASYDDVLPDSELGEEMPLIENVPSDIKGIVMLPGGVCAAFRDKEILFSEPWLPYSWPTEYRQTVDFTVVGLGVGGNDLYVMTEGEAYVISGTHPSNMTCTKVGIICNPACVAKRSIAQMGTMVIYASPDGLVGLSGGQGRLLTENLFQKPDWDKIQPATLKAGQMDGVYYGFFATGAIFFDPRKGLEALSTNDSTVTGTADPNSEYATCLFYDIVDDILYLCQTNTVKSWDTDTASKLTLRWRSKEFAGGRRQDFSCGRIVADAYPVTLRIYADGTLVSTLTVTSQDSFRVPILVPRRAWAIEVEGATSFDSFAISTSMKELS